MKSSDEILEKIQKLLQLANSDNEFEAKLAASKAQELLIKYNLSLEDIEEENKYNSETIQSDNSRSGSEWKYVRCILSEFYYVTIISLKTKRYAYIDGFKTKLGQSYMICGRPDNIIIAKYVQDFLTTAFINLFKKYREQTGSPTTSKNSFYLGLFSGLKEQLDQTKVKVETETGLVVVKDADLRSWIDEEIGGIKNTKQQVNYSDQSAANEGFSQGLNLKIAKGLDSKSTNKDIKRLT